ncbi:MAG TPA: phosphoribosylanthranilate isomerase [Elusimicrobiales bacterium]|nr:phosphoribosylanthranilate isomerase [Elusimicrobiales bacterium]
MFINSKTKPAVKICCIHSVHEARIAIENGASAVGLVSAMPSGPGVISEERIAKIASELPPDIASFLLTSLTDADAVIAQHKRCNTKVIQLCDRLSRGCHADIKRALPQVKLVQVVHVRGQASIDEALRESMSVDALLLDSGNQDLSVKELGGTGRIHDWNYSRRIVEECKIPVFLAGGLTHENVGRAVKAVNSFGLDICSGVRTDGKLDAAKVKKFFEAVASARRL